MKLIALPDLHESVESLDAIGNELARADLVLLPGDLANGNGAAGVARMLNRLRKWNPNVLAIPGPRDDTGIRALLTEERINLHRRHIVAGGCAVAGVGNAMHGNMGGGDGPDEASLTHALYAAVAGMDPTLPLVLMCHQPPAGTRFARGFAQSGSSAVRAFIEKIQPLVCFTGHIRGSEGIDKIGRTLVVNPGPLWEGWYEVAEVIGQRARVECRRLLPERTSL